MTAPNLCNFNTIRARDLPCGCAPPPLQCEVDEYDDLPSCTPGSTTYFPPPLDDIPIENGDVITVVNFCPTAPCPPNATIPVPFFYWDDGVTCGWYPFSDATISGDPDWFKEGTSGPFYGGVNTDKAYHDGPIAVRRTTVRSDMAIDVGDSTGTSDGGIVSEGLFIAGAIDPPGLRPALPITGAGTRLMWLPTYGAFRAGAVDGVQWDDNLIGIHSACFGTNNLAPGNSSFAIGDRNQAFDDFTFATGQNTIASLDSAISSGQDTTAGGDDSRAGGAYSSAINGRSIATGRNCVASGLRSWVHGWFAAVSGTTSFVQGEWVEARGDQTVLFGWNQSPTVAVYNQDKSFITHQLRPFLHCNSSAPTDSDIANSHFSIWLNEGTNELTFRVKDSGGTLRTGTITIS